MLAVNSKNVLDNLRLSIYLYGYTMCLQTVSKNKSQI